MQVTFEFASKAIISFSIYEASSENLFPFGDIELRGTKGTLYADYVRETGYRIIPSKPGQFQTWDKLMEAIFLSGLLQMRVHIPIMMHGFV